MRIKKIAILLSLVLTFSAFVSCKKDDSLQNGDYEIWTVASTEKILQGDMEYAHNESKHLYFDAVKNEYESCQLIIRAHKDIREYSLTKSDLVSSEENVIPKENIQIYVEKYVNITRSANASAGYPLGYYPDALVPIELADKYGELSVNAENNQGLYITVYVDANTPAGIYSGKFVLTLDGKKIEIPVSANIRDYTLTDECTLKTSFNINCGYVSAGEMNYSGEIYKNYYDMLLDYRLSAVSLPVTDLSDTAEFISLVKEYHDNPKVSAYCIPYTVGAVNEITVRNSSTYLNVMKKSVLALAEICTPETNYFDKAYIYCLDESDSSESEMQNSIRVLNSVYSMMEECVAEIAADKTEKYDGLKNIENWQDILISIKNVVPMSGPFTYNSWENETITTLLDKVSIWCPTYDKLNSESQRKIIAEKAEYYDSDIWWYGCMTPKSPYPTFHIDDTLLSARVLGWMQKEYDVDGILYWSVINTIANDSSWNTWPVDVYETPYTRSNLPAGDGTLVYPGARYGVDYPLPSMRLMSLRDGLEEYEMLADAERTFEEIAEEKDIETDGKLMLQELFADIYEGTQIKTDQNVFAEKRTLLLDTVEALDENYGFTIIFKEIGEGVADIRFIADDKYEVIADYGVLTKEGNVYKCILPLDKERNDLLLTLRSEDEEITIRKFIYGRYLMLCKFDAQVDGVGVSENSEFSISELHAHSGNSLYAEISSVLTGTASHDLIFKPTLKIGEAAFLSAVDFAELSAIGFDLYAEADCRLTVCLASGNSLYEVDTVELSEGENAVNVKITGQWSKIESVDGIALTFENAGTVESPMVYRFYLDNLYVS